MTLAVRARLRRRDFVLDVDFDVPLGGVSAIFGRSGCGKTTLLRIVAGMEKVRAARVYFGGKCWQDEGRFLPLHRRRVGLVFQEHSLLPHLSARGNLEYGYRRTSLDARRLAVPDVVDLLGIGRLLDRPIGQLSGGERQRISLGRALLTSPHLLLLDEPLAALDTQSKREIMAFLSRLAQQTEVPMLMVSHAPDEVEQLADRVMFMRDGRIERIEPLYEALARPNSPLFNEEGPVSVLEGTIRRADEEGLSVFESEGVRIILSAQAPKSDVRRRLRIVASDVSLALDKPVRISIRNHLPVTIERIDASRDETRAVACRLADGQLLLAQVTAHAVRELGLVPGLRVFALIKSVALL